MPSLSITVPTAPQSASADGSTMDSIISLMEEYTWRSLPALLGPGTRVAGVAVFCRAIASEDDPTSPNSAEHKAAAICLLILPSPSINEARHGSSPRTYSKTRCRRSASRRCSESGRKAVVEISVHLYYAQAEAADYHFKRHRLCVHDAREDRICGNSCFKM